MWSSVFGDLSTIVDECRAELVGAYLIDDPRGLALFGHTDRALLTPG
jgi:dipeptidyl-peptidase-3